MAEQLYKVNLLTLLLLPLSAVYWHLHTLHVLLYRTGLLRTRVPPVPVIVVGNLTVGGTGKTPLVAWLAQYLKAQGFNPGIIMRGYRGNSGGSISEVTADSSPAVVGDEAVLLARKTGVPVFVGRERYAAATRMLESSDCNVIISDDGLQHYALGRDIEIAVVDGHRRFGNGLLFPAGPLRESARRLQDVDYVLCRGGDARPGEIVYRLQPVSFVNVASGQQQALEFFRGQRVTAIAGIGNPDQFFDGLEQLGLEVNRRPFPDHHDFSPADLVEEKDMPIVMTEKDAVKCGGMDTGHCWALVVEPELPDNFGPEILSRLYEVKRNGRQTA